MIPRLVPGPRAAFCALLCLSVGCAAPRAVGGSDLVALDAEHRAELHAFAAEQDRVRRAADVTTVRDFGAAGRLHLREVALIGWPSAAYLRVEYTYVNSGGRTRRAPQVTLAVTDSERTLASVTQDLVLPLGIELGSESTYSSWLEVPVGDLYRRGDWRWDIRVEPRP